MADASDDINSWPGLIGQVNKTFNLVRDIFGYALPGGVFLAIGLISGRIHLQVVQDLLSPYQMPSWMAFIAIVAACYAVGNVMAATAYMPLMIAKYLVWMKYRHPNSFLWGWYLWRWYPKFLWRWFHDPREAVIGSPSAVSGPEEREISEEYEQSGSYVHYEHHERARSLPGNKSGPNTPPDSAEGSWRAWLLHHPTEVSQKMVEIRDQKPKLMEILDRRETQALLAASMTAALGGGWYVFWHAKWGFGTIVWVATAITFIQFLTGMPHVRRVFQATKEYYDDPTKNKPKEEPDFAPLLAALIKAATAALDKIGS